MRLGGPRSRLFTISERIFGNFHFHTGNECCQYLNDPPFLLSDMNKHLVWCLSHSALNRVSCVKFWQSANLRMCRWWLLSRGDNPTLLPPSLHLPYCIDFILLYKAFIALSLELSIYFRYILHKPHYPVVLPFASQLQKSSWPVWLPWEL